MRPGLSDDLRQIDDSRKTAPAVINAELSKLNVDITALQETRLADSGLLRERDYTFFWQGRGEKEARLHGVGFAVKNSLLSAIEPPTDGTERILALRLSSWCRTRFLAGKPWTLWNWQDEREWPETA